MNLANKKYLTFLLISLSVIAVSLFIFKKKEITPKLSFPKEYFFIEKLPISEALENQTFEFPKKMPLINFTFENIDQKKAEQIAQNLGFNEKPTIINDSLEGKKYFWTNDKHHLDVTPSTATVYYAQVNPQQFSQIKEEDEILLQNLALEFLKTKLLLNKNIEFASIEYYQACAECLFVKPVPKNQANYYRLYFRYENISYNAFLRSPTRPLAYVNIYPNGLVRSARITQLKTINNTTETLKIKSRAEILSSLQDAVLVAIRGGYSVPLPEIEQKDIQNVEVKKIDLAYLITDPKIKQMQPVFLLEGDIEISGKKYEKAQLYLSAFSEKQ